MRMKPSSLLVAGFYYEKQIANLKELNKMADN